MKKIPCHECAGALNNDEIAINIKLLGKQIGILRCYRCLSKALSCPEDELRKRTQYFRQMGCHLFGVDYIKQKGSVNT